MFDVTLKEYLKEIDAVSLLTAEQERDIGRLVIENNQQARELMVTSNLRLVVSIAKRYGNRGMGLSDVIAEGNLGLIRAVDYFDPERGIRFSTFATWWIKQSIKRALLEHNQPVHVPTYMVALISQWWHTTLELKTTLGRAPRFEEMVEIMQVSMRKAKIIHRIAEIEYNSDEETPDDTRPDDAMIACEEKRKAVELLNDIDPREAEVLRLHFGLGVEPMSLKEISKKMGLSTERIRQIQREALANLRKHYA